MYKYNAKTKRKIKRLLQKSVITRITTDLKTGKVTVASTDLKGEEIRTPLISKEAETKVKVPSHFLNSYFTTEDTLKHYQDQGQLQFDFKAEGDITDITKSKNILATIVSEGFKGINLSYQENRVIKGLFNLLNKQNASEQRPFIVLENKYQLYEEILERKVIKKGKYKDFSGAETKEVDKAIEDLQKNTQQIIIKGYDGIDIKTKKPLYFFYMRKTSLINLEYLKRNMPPEEAEKMTEEQLKETGQIRINILSIFLRDYHKYFKLIPKDLSKEIREKCPEVKKISKPIVDFIDLLHRQDSKGLINGNELRRARETLIKELKLEKMYKKNKRRTVKRLLSCYNMAKRTGYLEDYKIDQKGKYSLVDVFYLNIFKFEHLKPKQIEANTGLEKRLTDDHKD
jgi:hypothetical protein